LGESGRDREGLVELDEAIEELLGNRSAKNVADPGGIKGRPGGRCPQSLTQAATGSFLGGVASLEGAYWDSEEDRSGTDPSIENSEVKALAGYSCPLWKDATLGVQGYLEWTMDYDAFRATLPVGYPAQEESRWTATTRLTQLLRNQTVTGSLFAFWGVTDEDGYLIPSVRYAATDNVSLEFGANVFFGRETHTTFGALDENDNVYANMRYSF